jgi:predicted RNase H-like HicB family nuclease
MRIGGCAALYRPATVRPEEREGHMYRVWYWATIDREYDGRFIASIPDLWDLAAYGDTDKDAVAHVTDLASERVRTALDDGQQIPPRRQSSELPSHMGELSSRWRLGAGKRGRLRLITCRFELKRSKASQQSGNA